MTIADAQGQPSGADTGQETTPQSDQGSAEYSLAADFLKQVPQEHLSIVEPLVKKWDAGVTRRFQDIHGQYAPYKELGEVEDLQRAVGLIQMLNDTPERFYYALQEQLGLADGTQTGTPQILPQGQSQAGGEQSPPSLPPELQARIDSQEEMIKNLAEYVLNLHQTSEAASEDAELDEYMNLLHEEFGDFDDEYVLTKMYHGANGEEAVKSFQKLTQQQINAANQATSGLPPTLSSGSGGGAAPAEQFDLGKIPNKEVKSLVADILAQSQR